MNTIERIATIEANTHITLSNEDFSLSSRSFIKSEKLNHFRKSMTHLEAAIELLVYIEDISEMKESLKDLLWTVGESQGEEWAFGTHFSPDAIPSDTVDIPQISFLYGKLMRGKELLERKRAFAVLYEKAVEGGVNDFYRESFAVSLSRNAKKNKRWLEKQENILRELVERTLIDEDNLEGSYRAILSKHYKELDTATFDLEEDSYKFNCRIDDNRSWGSSGKVSNLWKMALDGEIIKEVISKSTSEIGGLWEAFARGRS